MKKLLVAAFLCAFLVPAADASTLFRGVRLFDGTKVIETTDVLVRDGRIAAVGRNLAAGAGVEVVEGKGKTLLPGLIDSHTHAWGDALQEALIFGVTTELDMFTSTGFARSMREEQAAASGAPARADLFSAGTLVTAPGGHGTEYGMTIPTISGPAEAQDFVDARIAEGSDWIKIVYDDGSAYGMKTPTVDAATLRAVIAAAHKRRKLAVVHIGTLADARTALEAGADGLVHLFIDSVPDPKFGKLAAKHKAFVIPTLVVLQSVTGTGSGALVEDARMAPYLKPASRAELKRSFPVRSGVPPRIYKAAEASVKQLIAARVPILAGSDAPNPGTAHGAALHRELELLVGAGMTPVQALAAATSVPAKAFQLTDRGAVAKGMRADLLLVDGDPTRDITLTRAIEGVWKGGVAVSRAAYAKSVSEMLVAATSGPKGLDVPVLSDFETGVAAAAFGTPWMPSADSIAGGKSTGLLTVVDGGAAGTNKALAISGTIDAALPYAWFGAMWSPTETPMAPANLSGKKELRFLTRGDGKTYRVMVFAQSKGIMPLMATFVASEAWTEVVMPWTQFGTDGKDIMAVIFSGGPQPGAFAFQVDEVTLR